MSLFMKIKPLSGSCVYRNVAVLSSHKTIPKVSNKNVTALETNLLKTANSGMDRGPKVPVTIVVALLVQRQVARV